MKNLAKALAFTALLAFALPVFAHEGHDAIIGEIVSISADGFQLKTEKETITIKFSDKTTFEKDKKPVDKTHLKKGDRVAVTGSKQMSGDTMATHVRLGLPTAKAKPATKS
ncbi:MAG: hypothetical protein KA385_03890 [Vicinamibacteria bacterium]|nr:hypothetical protein [Vicinamibacteria bacterium]